MSYKKKRVKMSFNDFKRKCFDFFEMYKWWSFMSNLRVWEKLPGDETEGKTIWYCLWNIRPEVTMILFYDYGDDSDDLQFVVYVDWKAGAYENDVYFENGKFSFVAEYDNIEQALECMRFEPTKYLANPTKKCKLDYILFQGEDPDTCPALGVGFLESYSLLEAIDVLNDYAMHPNEHDKGHIGTIVWMPYTGIDTVLFEKKMGS